MRREKFSQRVAEKLAVFSESLHGIDGLKSGKEKIKDQKRNDKRNCMVAVQETINKNDDDVNEQFSCRCSHVKPDKGLRPSLRRPKQSVMKENGDQDEIKKQNPGYGIHLSRKEESGSRIKNDSRSN
ncbi:MAG: hypothetical protein ABUT20_51100 [Bacteroidota bacterium]